MKQSFKDIECEGMVLISDRDKGLQAAVHEVLPQAHHSHCCQHLADNIQKNYKLVCRNLFWGAAYAYTEHAFKEAMQNIRAENEDAYEYLNEISYTLWSQFAFPAPRFGHITSNIAESVNSSWSKYRSLPVLQLFLSTWTKTMETMHLRRHRKHLSGKLTDYARKRLDNSYQQARRYKVKTAKKGLAYVLIPDGGSHIVDLEKQNCSCGEFQEFLIPCCHAVAVCLWQDDDPYNYVHDWYSTEYYHLTYSRHMHPVRDEDLVEGLGDCGAPQTAKQRGRPKKTRYRREEKDKRSIVCSHCKQKGHNRRSCRNAAQN